jgi:hypothetical protein
MEVADMTDSNITATNINTQAEAWPVFIHIQTHIPNFSYFGSCDTDFRELDLMRVRLEMRAVKMMSFIMNVLQCKIINIGFGK